MTSIDVIENAPHARDDVYRRHGIFCDFWHCLVCKSTVSQLDHDPASCTIGRWYESRSETLSVFFSSFFSDLSAAISRISRISRNLSKLASPIVMHYSFGDYIDSVTL